MGTGNPKEEIRYNIPPSRVGKKFVGGFFDPLVAKELKLLAVKEDTTIQLLVVEAINMLFKRRNIELGESVKDKQ
jgi:hypothetical protein